VRALGLDGGGDYWVPPATGGGGGVGEGRIGKTDERTDGGEYTIPLVASLSSRAGNFSEEAQRAAAGRRMLPACRRVPAFRRFLFQQVFVFRGSYLYSLRT
jgi:hypothetical protein